MRLDEQKRYPSAQDLVALASKQDLAERGQPSGYPGLDSDGKLSTVPIVLENRTSDPSSPAVGEIWLRTDL